MLILQRGGESGETWPLEHRTLTIGRSPDCDIVLDDRQISRLHARVVWRDDHYEIEDLASKNGTHLNGRDVVAPQPLHDGDEIQVALRYKLAFVDAGATAPLTLDAPLPRGLRLDTAGRRVYVNGKPLEPPLSAQQYRLLEVLLGASGVVVPRRHRARGLARRPGRRRFRAVDRRAGAPSARAPGRGRSRAPIHRDDARPRLSLREPGPCA